MFKLETDPTFTHDVKLLVPIDGGHRTESLKVTYRALPVDKAEAFDLSDGASSTAFLQAIIAGLDDIVGPDGKAIPYSNELRDRVILVPYVRTALTRTYFEVVGKALAGN